MKRQKLHDDYVKTLINNTVPMQTRFYQRALAVHYEQMMNTQPKPIRFDRNYKERQRGENINEQSKMSKQLSTRKKVTKGKHSSQLLVSNLDEDSDTQQQLLSPTTVSPKSRRSKFKKGGDNSDADNSSVSSQGSVREKGYAAHENLMPVRKVNKKKKAQQAEEFVNKVAYTGLRDGQDNKAREDQLRSIVIEFNKQDRERKDRMKMTGEIFDKPIEIMGFGLNNTTWQKQEKAKNEEQIVSKETKFKYQNDLNQKFMQGVNELKNKEADLFNQMEDILEEENQMLREIEMERKEQQ